MEIIMTPEDKKMIDKTRNGEDHLKLYLISPNQEKCSLELKVTDPYKCHRFLTELFYNNKDYIKEECGFEVTAVSLLGVYSDFNTLKEDVLKSVVSTFEDHNL